MKKKKLEFVSQKICEAEESVINPTQENYCNLEQLDVKALEALVAEKRAKLQRMQKRQSEMAELQNLINKWKEAGLDGIEQLRKTRQDPVSNEEILDSFKIPHEAFL